MQIQFNDNPKFSADQYICITVKTAAVLESWKDSIFSYEWLTQDGTIKSLQELTQSEQEKRRAVEEKIKAAQTLEKPVLGIGIMENVEIGSGRAEFLTLTALGVETIPVYVPKSHEKTFKPFQA